MDGFKYYRNRNADLTALVDCDSPGSQAKLKRKTISRTTASFGRFGVLPPQSWDIFELHGHPGLILIRNPFTALGQRYWTVRCLRDYHRPPNKTNLTNLGKDVDDWWRDLQETKDKADAVKLRNSLRWVTLGYHHNWDTKIYSEESFNEFPKDLDELISTVLAPALGYNDFTSQAAIVNYYPQGTTLSGHTDHSERNLEAPLFSISFGQSAIFLIGGPEKTNPATAVLLRSGDVLVMSKESRLCYHAVPRILKGAEEVWNDVGKEEVGDVDAEDDLWKQCRSSEFWTPYNEYLRECRINLNVRQVLNKDEKGI